MKKFLTQVAEYVHAQHPTGWQDVLLVFPNHRAGFYFQEEIKRLLHEGDWLPEVTTIQSFVHERSPLSLLSNIELLNLLYKSYTEVGGTDDFEPFITTAQTMLADFEELDKQLVDPTLFFKNLKELKSLEIFLEDDETLTDYSRNYQKFWGYFRDCYFALGQALRTTGNAYSGMLYRHVAEGLATIDFSDYARVYFVGFAGLAKSEEKIIAHLLDAGQGEFLIDADSYYTQNSEQEAGHFFREYKKTWKIKSFNWVEPSIESSPKEIKIIGVARNIGQAKLTADILQNHLKLSGEALKDTVVVLLDETLLQPVIAYLPDTVDKVNITMGLPLAYTQLADFIRHINTLQQNATQSETSGVVRFYYRDVIALFQHSYYRSLSHHGAQLPDVITTIRRNNKITIAATDLASWFPRDKDLLACLYRVDTDTKGYLAHINQLLDLLRKALLMKIYHGAEQYKQDIEVVYWLHKIINRLEHQLADYDQVWTVKAVQKLLENEMRNTRLPYESDRADGLQIMGVFETRCLDFKNVIMLSMNEGVFPSGKAMQSYIPHALRHGKMTTHYERDAVSAYLFYRLMQRAEKLYYVYNTESDTLGGGEKSRLLLQVQHEMRHLSNIKIEESNFVLGTDIVQQEKPIEIAKDESVLALLKPYLEERGLSPTSLNTYINCSLQFYFKNVLKLAEQEEVSEELDTGTIGSAVHKALEEIYKHTIDKPLTADYLRTALADTATIAKLIKTSLMELYEEQSLREGKNYLLYQVCQSLVINFLKNEINRVEELAQEGKTVTIRYLEQHMTTALSIGDFTVKLQGMTDRAELVDGIVTIADYKTGNSGSTSNKLAIDDITLLKSDTKYSKSFQLLMYAWLYSQAYGLPASGLRSGIYWLRNADANYQSFTMAGSDIIDKSKLASFEELLKEILLEIVDTNNPFTKTEDIKRCQYCDFVRICGRD